MSEIIVIVGPTASGKTKLSIELAKYLNAEIINADAVSIYKSVNIGTAKVMKNDMDGIIHHMLDFNPLSNKYTIFDYQRDARKVLDELIIKNKNVIIVGGSGLYIKALLYDYHLEKEDKKNNEYDKYTNEELKEMIDNIYPNNEIHVNNRKRMIRFLNHYDNTSNIIKNNEEKDKPLYDFKIIGLEPNREQLYKYISSRVDNMFDNGLLEEANDLYQKGENTNSIIGYKELNKYFDRKVTLEEAKEEIKKNTRHYAKRQMTWFKNQFSNVSWIKVDYENFTKTIEEAKKMLG